MKVLVTGVTGFIGRHLLPRLLAHGHEVSVIIRNLDKLKSFGWHRQIKLIEADIETSDTHWSDDLGEHDALLHLAWSGLPNYQQDFHLTHTLPAHQRFLATMVERGIEQILVTGSCLEYGRQSGCLAESMAALPDNPYAQAKDQLRQWLQSLQQQHDFVLQWTRLFYMYGEGQNPNSLIPQLDTAIIAGEKQFNMSGGQQLRDYLPVEVVAEYLREVLERQDCDGLVNICSGEPLKVIDLVKQHIRQKYANIELNLGHYPYTDYEAMAFWGNPQKLLSWLNPSEKESVSVK